MPHKDPEKAKAYRQEKWRKQKAKGIDPQFTVYQILWRFLREDEQRLIKWRHRGINITLDQYRQMMREQSGLCLLCQKQPESGYGKLVPDHCHTTGRIRGLLCERCNLALGLLKDDAFTAERIVPYLEGDLHGENPIRLSA